MLLDVGSNNWGAPATKALPQANSAVLPKLKEFVEGLPPVRKEKKLKVLSECELRFLIDSNKAREALEHHSSTKKWLEQRYLDPSFIPQLRTLLERLGRARIPEDLILTSARLRRVRKDGAVTYYLELKGPKKEVHLTRIERAEISELLGDRQLIRILRKAATDGLIRKTRHRIKGKVWNKDGKAETIYAQLDFITSCGIGKECTFFRNPPFVTIDVEMAPRWIKDFRAGRHNLKFLTDHAIEISSLASSELGQFSNKALARYGIRSRLVTAARGLLARISQIASKVGYNSKVHS